MADPSYIGKGTFTYGTGALSVPFPASPQNGDTIFLVINEANQSYPASVSYNGGASTLAYWDGIAGGAVSCHVYYTTYVTGESTANVSVPDSGSYTAAQMFLFRDVYSMDGDSSINLLTTTSMYFPSVGSVWPWQVGAMPAMFAGLDKDLADADTINDGTLSNSYLDSLTVRAEETTSSGTGGGIALVTGVLNAETTDWGTTTATADTATTRAYVTVLLLPEPKLRCSIAAEATVTGALRMNSVEMQMQASAAAVATPTADFTIHPPANLRAFKTAVSSFTSTGLTTHPAIELGSWALPYTKLYSRAQGAANLSGGTAVSPYFVARGTYTTASFTSITVPWPAGYQDGDLALLIMLPYGEAFSAPSGWTLLTTAQTSSPYQIQVFEKYVSGAQTNPVLTFSGNPKAGQMYVFRNCHQRNSAKYSQYYNLSDKTASPGFVVGQTYRTTPATTVEAVKHDALVHIVTSPYDAGVLSSASSIFMDTIEVRSSGSGTFPNLAVLNSPCNTDFQSDIYRAYYDTVTEGTYVTTYNRVVTLALYGDTQPPPAALTASAYTVATGTAAGLTAAPLDANYGVVAVATTTANLTAYPVLWASQASSTATVTKAALGTSIVALSSAMESGWRLTGETIITTYDTDGGYIYGWTRAATLRHITVFAARPRTYSSHPYGDKDDKWAQATTILYNSISNTYHKYYPSPVGATHTWGMPRVLNDTFLCVVGSYNDYAPERATCNAIRLYRVDKADYGGFHAGSFINTTLPFYAQWGDIAYGNGVYAVIATQERTTGDLFVTNRYVTSTDFVNWTVRTLPYASDVTSLIVFIAGKFVINGYTSVDAVDWSVSETALATDNYVDGRMFGSSGTTVDGVNWAPSGGFGYGYSVAKITTKAGVPFFVAAPIASEYIHDSSSVSISGSLDGVGWSLTATYTGAGSYIPELIYGYPWGGGGALFPGSDGRLMAMPYCDNSYDGLAPAPIPDFNEPEIWSGYVWHSNTAQTTTFARAELTTAAIAYPASTPLEAVVTAVATFWVRNELLADPRGGVSAPTLATVERNLSWTPSSAGIVFANNLLMIKQYGGTNVRVAASLTDAGTDYTVTNQSLVFCQSTEAMPAFVAINGLARTQVYASTDGITFSLVYTHSVSISNIQYVNGRYYAWSTASTASAYSDNGTSWTAFSRLQRNLPGVSKVYYSRGFYWTWEVQSGYVSYATNTDNIFGNWTTPFFSYGAALHSGEIYQLANGDVHIELGGTIGVFEGNKNGPYHTEAIVSGINQRNYNPDGTGWVGSALYDGAYHTYCLPERLTQAFVFRNPGAMPYTSFLLGLGFKGLPLYVSTSTNKATFYSLSLQFHSRTIATLGDYQESDINAYAASEATVTSAVLTIPKPLAASRGAIATVLSAVLGFGAIVLQGSLTAVATLTGVIRTMIFGNAYAVSTATAAITTQIRLASASAAASTADANLTVISRIYASAASESTATADISVFKRFYTSAVSEAVAAASLDTQILLAGGGYAVFSVGRVKFYEDDSIPSLRANTPHAHATVTSRTRSALCRLPSL